MNKDYRGIVKTLPHSMELGLDVGRLPTLADAVKYIDRMDFSLIKEKLVSGDILLCRKWALLEAEIAIQYYRNFLF